MCAAAEGERLGQVRQQRGRVAQRPRRPRRGMARREVHHRAGARPRRDSTGEERGSRGCADGGPRVEPREEDATAGELVDWPVAVGNSVAQMPRTVRFGSSAVQPAAGSLCGAPWAALDDGVTVEGEGARGFGGLLCVDDPSAPVWYGWATAHTADVCAAGATAVPCTASRQFVISVR